MDNSIRSQVLGKDTISYPAELSDYELTNHSYAFYLTIKEKKDSFVKGVIFQVNDKDIKLLDRYENGLYDRITVNVKVNYKSNYDSFAYIEKKLSDIIPINIKSENDASGSDIID